MMKSTIWGLVLLCQGISASAGMTPKQIRKEIQRLLPEDLEVGIKVVALHDRAGSATQNTPVILAINENQLLKPASNIKLVTTLAALKLLGLNFRFKTKIYRDGPIRKGVLQGNLIIKGFGDPFLVSEQLWFLTNELKRKGFRKVEGDLIIDESYFDEKLWVHEGSNHIRQRAYDAPLGAVSINFNTTTVYVSPAATKGQKPRVTIDPDNDYIRVINKGKTGGEKNTLQVLRVPGRFGDTIVVSGMIPWGATEKRFYRNISYPGRYAARMFRRFFKEQGITIRGRDRFEPIREGSQELFVYESKPLRNIVSDLNRISNNFIAEQMLKTMAAVLKGPPGSTDKGVEVLKEFLKELGIAGNFEIVNGSGLSEKNLMTASQFIEVLKYGYRHFDLFPEYVGSMAIAGMDGTVEKRLQNTIAEAKVRAKTGSLENVSALSGYLNTVERGTLAFSIIMNDTKNRNILMQHIQDQILLFLTDLE